MKRCRAMTHPDLRSLIERAAVENFDAGPGVRNQVMHSRHAVGRLRFWSDELEPETHQPFQRARGLGRQKSAQLRVVSRLVLWRELAHIRSMPGRVVGDP